MSSVMLGVSVRPEIKEELDRRRKDFGIPLSVQVDLALRKYWEAEKNAKYKE